MAKVHFELNRAGVRELLKSPGLSEECRKHAEATLQACGSVEGYVMEERHYPNRNGYAVYAKEYPAIADNLKNNTLLKARR